MKKKVKEAVVGVAAGIALSVMGGGCLSAPGMCRCSRTRIRFA